MRPVVHGVSFGRHRFDLETGCVWSGKREIRMFASVWNSTVISDDALKSCIQELRKALAAGTRAR